MKKRLSGVLVAVLLCCSILTPTAAAAEKVLIANSGVMGDYNLFSTAKITLSDCLDTTQETLRSYTYDKNIREETVTIYHVSKNSICTIAPTAETTDRLFLSLSEYILKDGFLDTAGCFESIQPIGDGRFKTEISPVSGELYPTAEKPAKIVFGANSKDKLWFTADTPMENPYDVVLKPGYLYCIGVGGEYNWYGDRFWFSISDTESAPPASNLISATPTASKVMVNGKEVSFDAYNINANNYFKIRDVAMAVNGTGKQFNVFWDAEKKAVQMVSNTAYATVGGELAKGDGNAKTATPTTAPVYLDGKTVALTTYNINGNNYIKLRDLGQALNFDVRWDSATSSIIIDTAKGYTG